MLDLKIVEKWFGRYPDLMKFIDAGTISLKMAREILGVDRYFMYDMYKELTVAGAIYPSGNNSWRASNELKQYLKERRSNDK